MHPPTCHLLVDNGSIRAESHLMLKDIARRMSQLAGHTIHPVSLNYSDRIPRTELEGEQAWTLEAFVHEQYKKGYRNFHITPFFIAAAGALAKLMHDSCDTIQAAMGAVQFNFSPYLFDPYKPHNTIVAQLVSDLVNDCLSVNGLKNPHVIVLDHGSPKAEATAVRNTISEQVSLLLGDSVGAVAPASMERRKGDKYAFNEPLLESILRTEPFDSGDVIIALLFLLPGRHAGSEGDIQNIIQSAQKDRPQLRPYMTKVMGAHKQLPQYLLAP